MVYCSKCGTLNADDAVHCTNCGAPLSVTESRPYARYERRKYYRDENDHHRGSGFGLLIAGLFVIVIGLAALTGFAIIWSYFWPIILVLIGIWLLMWGLRRNRKYKQMNPQ